MRVMLLRSFGQDFKPWGEYARTILSELHSDSSLGNWTSLIITR
jgi:hypothetical protein